VRNPPVHKGRRVFLSSQFLRLLIQRCHEPLALAATICDQGRSFDIDLAEWLRTTALGGGFVTVEPGR